MMQKQKISLQRLQILEKLGIVVSLICAVHCMVLPLVLIGMSFSDSNHSHLGFDLVMLSLAAVLIILSISKSYQKHKNKNAFIPIGIGIIFYMLAFMMGHKWYHLFFILGAVSWLVSHVLNHRYLHQCK